LVIFKISKARRKKDKNECPFHGARFDVTSEKNERTNSHPFLGIGTITRNMAKIFGIRWTINIAHQDI
jgi:hypothetical protein